MSFRREESCTKSISLNTSKMPKSYKIIHHISASDAMDINIRDANNKKRVSKHNAAHMRDGRLRGISSSIHSAGNRHPTCGKEYDTSFHSWNMCQHYVYNKNEVCLPLTIEIPHITIVNLYPFWRTSQTEFIYMKRPIRS